LWRGSALQITRTVPRRLMILQRRQIFLTEALTFMVDLPNFGARANYVRESAPAKLLRLLNGGP